MTLQRVRGALGIAALIACLTPAAAQAQVPEDIYQGLLKIGQIVDPACTAKLYRPLMPANDYNTYWPPDAPAPVVKGPLYPGVTIARDQSFGEHPKDLVDIFVADSGGGNRPVLMWVPGGGGNKIEQQVREGNAFYDNIGRWGTKNGYVVVTVQRHPGTSWDDAGRDISIAVDWVKANISKYRGNPNHIVIGAHSAGTGPLGVYVGHPERWKNGVQVKAAFYMSGNPIPSLAAAARGNAAGPGAGAPPAGGAPGAGRGPGAGSTCGTTAAQNGTDGVIAGPSGATPAAPRQGGPGARGGGRGGPPLTPEEQAERDNVPGFKATNVKVMLVRAELDGGVTGDMLPADHAIHDELCKVDGPKAKDGEAHCPVMLFAKRHSHMSEVFAFDTKDTTVSGPILAWLKKVK